MDLRRVLENAQGSVRSTYDSGVESLLDRLGLEQKRSTMEVVLPALAIFGTGLAVGAALDRRHLHTLTSGTGSPGTSYPARSGGHGPACLKIGGPADERFSPPAPPRGRPHRRHRAGTSRAGRADGARPAPATP